jgi:hypothetical protein
MHTCSNMIRVFLTFLFVSLLLFSCKKKKEDEPVKVATNACNFNGWPTATTVGLPTGTPLRVVTTDLRTTQDGQVIEGLDMRARIYVRHKNVTIRNCMLKGDYYYAVYTQDAGDNGPLLIENCDITGGIATLNNVTFRNNHIYAPAGGFKNDGLIVGGNNILIENNLIHNLRGDAGSHMDGIQVLDGNNIIIRNNWVEVADNPETGEDGGPTAAIFIHSHEAPTINVTVECNMIIMKNDWYPLRLYDITGNVIVRHNRWAHGALKDIAVDFDSPAALSLLWEDNAFDDGIVIPDPSK